MVRNEMPAVLAGTLSGIEPKVHNWSDTLDGELPPARAATVRWARWACWESARPPFQPGGRLPPIHPNSRGKS